MTAAELDNRINSKVSGDSTVCCQSTKNKFSYVTGKNKEVFCDNVRKRWAAAALSSFAISFSCSQVFRQMRIHVYNQNSHWF